MIIYSKIILVRPGCNERFSVLRSSIASPATSAVWVIAVVACGAGGCGQVGGVARATALAAVIHTSSAFISDAGVRAIVFCRSPGAGVVAIRTFLPAEHPGVEPWAAVAA
jgi:hypothetical protein